MKPTVRPASPLSTAAHSGQNPCYAGIIALCGIWGRALANDNAYVLMLKRYLSNQQCTMGELFDPHGFVSYTLEDVVREVPGEPVEDWKIPHKTAIPAGKYRLLITYSMRFQRELPILLNVPGFAGVRIHAGNTAKDTDGCILLGLAKDDSGCAVWHSREAMQLIQPKITEALKSGEVYLNVLNG